MLKLPAEIISVIESINSSGYDAFLVGGWVRDALLMRPSNDFDITTNAPVEVLESLFQAYKPSRHASHLGSVSFLYHGFALELTRFRKESNYRDFRHPDTIEFVSDLKTDLYRRDFTINTLCYHPTLGLIDYFNAMDDLKQGILRCVGDPTLRFEEDALRILRLYRFKSELAFTIEAETEKAAQALMNQLTFLKTSEYKQEFFKLIVSEGFLTCALEEPMLLASFVPELKEALHFDQLNPYHRYTLYEHSMRVSGALPPTVTMRLVGIFHDLGKLRTQIIDDKGIGHYRHHAQASVEIITPYLKAFQLKKKEQNLILKLIAYHDFSLKESLDSLYPFAYEHSVAFTRDLILLKRCDNAAKSDRALYQVTRCDAFSRSLDEVETLPLKVSDLKIDNAMLLAKGVKQVQVSQVLKKILDRVVALNVGHDLAQQEAILEGVLNHDIYQSE